MKKEIIIALSFVYIAFILSNSQYVLSAPSLNQSNITVQAGNVTALNIDGDSITNVWQGYFGTITGGILLDNADGFSMYEWDVVNAQGEIMATREIISDWSKVNCSKQTEIYWEEYRLNIPNSSTQGINDTFLNTTHPSFDIGTNVLSGCRSTLTDNSTAEKVVFWNIILNTNSTTSVYVGIIDNEVIGFNGSAVDYQLLLPTNQTTGLAKYNFYLDLS